MISKKLYVVFFCLLIPFIKTLGQQDINFTTISTKEGLSSNSVNAIVKDSYGIMWFATEDGLNRFDGTNFTVYRHVPGNQKTIQSNDIPALFEDGAGNLWIGPSGGALGLYDRKNDNFINYSSSENPDLPDNTVIRGICNDAHGKLWIAHFNGVKIFDPATKAFSVFSPGSGLTLTMSVICVFRDSQNQMWIGLTKGLFVYNESTGQTKQFLHDPADATSICGNTIHSIVEDKEKNIWIGTETGLSMLAHNSNHFTNYLHDEGNPESISNSHINALALDGENKLWIGTSDGLNLFDKNSGKSLRIMFDSRNGQGISAKSMTSIFVDQQGICWMGTYRGGINKYDRNLNLFNLIKSNPFDNKSLIAPIVTSFADADNGKVYVGTDGGGVSIFDPQKKSFQQIELISSLQKTKARLAVLALTNTRNNQLLVGTFADGLFVLDRNSGKYRQITKGDNTDDLNSNEIFCIKEDSKGNRWVGTNGDGINVLNQDNKVILRYTPTPRQPNDKSLPLNGFIRYITEDKNGDFWIATHGGGIAFLETVTGRFTVYTTRDSKLPNDKVITIVEDSHGNIWVGTMGGGIGLFNKATHQFSTISESDGLLNNTVCKIVEDSKGLLWISTNKGLCTFDPIARKFTNYTYHNGTQGSNFVNRSGLQSSTGYLFFGGLEGFNYFNPQLLRRSSPTPAVLITDLKISNKTVFPGEDAAIKENISIAKRIDLNYKQNFTLSFVGLNYTTPEQNIYAYKLEGFDKDWNYVGSSNTASYTNLDPGNYVFYVKAGNSSGEWSTQSTSIKIYVHPPFWRTTYAYIFYILVVLGTFVFIRYKGIQKIRRKYLLEQEKYLAEQERKETERIHELNKLKLKFLTNLSHEFRTPISLILGPVDSLITQEKSDNSKAQLGIIKRNGKRLLNLVNQLLDFRKMEEQELKLQAKKAELISFIRDVVDSFQDLSERKKIGLVFNSTIESFTTLFDHDKIERIIFNLLSNAFKFTPEGGIITFSVEKENRSGEDQAWIIVKVKDTGIGIPEDKKEAVFGRFFQTHSPSSILNQGSGIGLSITKEFVKMHGGTIEVESEISKGSTFTVRLPFIEFNDIPQTAEPVDPVTDNDNAQYDEELVQPAEVTDSSIAAEDLKKTSILLVEDNDDFRFYLKENLRLHYKVIEAVNGVEGWQKTLSAHPKLIVSDIGMPDMDGIDLCKKIKADKRTSHIPVILLTAFTGEQEQLKGLKTGASDYITKPFNFEILNAKIKNLLLLNDSFKSTYSRQVEFISPKIETETESASDKLIQKVVAYIEENLTDTQLSVENLSKHVGMSRSTLYSKLLELTGQTPVEFIRSVKLDKAAQLLANSEMNVAEIAYTVGFSTPNYFTKSFRAKYNMLPSEYISTMRKSNKN
ncbi:hybrid sensor histidine kinase/response regulator transcription factor [Ferruginibacter sp.]